MPSRVGSVPMITNHLVSARARTSSRRSRAFLAAPLNRFPRGVLGRFRCRHELLDRTLIWDQRHLLKSLQEFGRFHNQHRSHRTLQPAAPLRPLPEPITDPERIAHLDVRRPDRLGGTLHEYRHAA
jgi:hypothetical protein